MIAQISEILHYQGRKQPMCTEPLGNYFALAGIEPRFEVSCTALWRGYVGEWDIQDGRLQCPLQQRVDYANKRSGKVSADPMTKPYLFLSSLKRQANQNS
jgi:hypothetical protein